MTAPGEVTGEPAERPAIETGGPRSVYEPAANPFVRDGRSGRGSRQRQNRDGASPARGDSGADADVDADADAAKPLADDKPIGLDPMALPASLIDPKREAVAEPENGGDDDAPKPKRRGRRPAPRAGEGGEALQAVN